MKKYRPSSGREGEAFMSSHCYQCIHERWIHFQDEDRDEDKCDIMSRSLVYEIDDPRYPKEWVIINNEPTCLEFKKWDWGQDGDARDPDNPNAPIPVAPNQLMMPFGPWELLGISEDILITPLAIVEK
jgi:hypothetical protein